MRVYDEMSPRDLDGYITFPIDLTGVIIDGSSLESSEHAVKIKTVGTSIKILLNYMSNVLTLQSQNGIVKVPIRSPGVVVNDGDGVFCTTTSISNTFGLISGEFEFKLYIPAGSLEMEGETGEFLGYNEEAIRVSVATRLSTSSELWGLTYRDSPSSYNLEFIGKNIAYEDRIHVTTGFGDWRPVKVYKVSYPGAVKKVTLHSMNSDEAKVKADAYTDGSHATLGYCISYQGDFHYGSLDKRSALDDGPNWDDVNGWLKPPIQANVKAVGRYPPGICTFMSYPTVLAVLMQDINKTRLTSRLTFVSGNASTPILPTPDSAMYAAMYGHSPALNSLHGSLAYAYACYMVQLIIFNPRLSGLANEIFYYAKLKPRKTPDELYIPITPAELDRYAKALIAIGFSIFRVRSSDDADGIPLGIRFIELNAVTVQSEIARPTHKGVEILRAAIASVVAQFYCLMSSNACLIVENNSMAVYESPKLLAFATHTPPPFVVDEQYSYDRVYKENDSLPSLDATGSWLLWEAPQYIHRYFKSLKALHSKLVLRFPNDLNQYELIEPTVIATLRSRPVYADVESNTSPKKVVHVYDMYGRLIDVTAMIAESCTHTNARAAAQKRSVFCILSMPVFRFFIISLYRSRDIMNIVLPLPSSRISSLKLHEENRKMWPKGFRPKEASPPGYLSAINSFSRPTKNA
jgi:hypothetical protein